MGINGSPLGLRDLFMVTAETRQSDDAAELRTQAANAEAMRFLAEMMCPADLLDWGRRHGIPAFAEVTWNAGFMAGWRAAQTRKAYGMTEIVIPSPSPQEAGAPTTPQGEA